MSDRTVQLGAVGKPGRWTAGPFRVGGAVGVGVALSLGALAPRAENALSGAGWEATGSESVQARDLIDKNLDGFGSYGLVVAVHAESKSVSDAAFRRAISGVQAKLTSSTAVTTVARPRVTADRHAAVI